MKCIGLTPREEELEKIIRSVDADKSGSLSFPEFVKLMLHEVNKCRMKEIRGFFSDFDRDGDGKVTADEVRKVFLMGGFSDQEAERILRDMLAATDFNKDGVIDFEGEQRVLSVHCPSCIATCNCFHRAPSQPSFYANVTSERWTRMQQAGAAD